MEWRWQTMDDLSKAELYAILRARQEVFVVGQSIRYVDADGKDFDSYHLSGWRDGDLVAYLRAIPLAESGVYKVGRVLTREAFRGQGLGEALMWHLLQVAARDFGPCRLTMSAQHYLERFYQKFGFQSIGAVYDEEGLPHINMGRDLNGAP